MMPPGISMLDMYLINVSVAVGLLETCTHWSKNGSKSMTSSPGSMKAMNALSMPSFAPVVMVTSVFGLISFPKNGE